MGNTLVWEKGRQLKQYGANTYKYNNEGIRIKKTTSTENHENILDGTNIVKEIVTDTANCPKYVNEYLYDLDGTVCGLKYNGTAYYFYKNLQGDVIAITDDAGATVARYTYDAWGKVLSVTDARGTDISKTETHIANINPFRYRSYYYDADTELYYLQSRYYNPEVGRFINADDTLNSWIVAEDLLSSNIYAYCNNNPINNSDDSGYSFKNNLFKVIKSLGFKALKILKEATKVFVQCVKAGKIPCAVLTIIIDMIIGLLIPALPTAMQKVAKILLGYKSINKDMAKIALRNIQKGLGKALAAFGIALSLNIAFSIIVNALYEFNLSRFLTIGGILCFLLDWADNTIDMWIDFPKIGKRIAGLF